MEDNLLDINESSLDEVSSDLYNLAHCYAAIDFEVRKYAGKNADRGSVLEKLRNAHIKIKKRLDDIGCVVEPLPSQLYEINYCLNLSSKNYKLNSGVIIKVHRGLDAIIDNIPMKY